MFDSIVFESFSEFLQMGSYAFHVWTVYILFTIFIIANLLLPRIQRKQFIREQKNRALRDVQMKATAKSGSDALETSALAKSPPGESV